MKLKYLYESKQQEGIIDRTRARFAGAKGWVKQVGKNIGSAFSGNEMVDPRTAATQAKIQSIATSKATEILTDWYKLGLTKSAPHQANVKRMAKVFATLLSSKKSISGKALSKSLAGKMPNILVKEGWLDRAAANVSGFKARTATSLKNVTGNAGQIFRTDPKKAKQKDPRAAQKQAKINSIALSSAKSALQDWYKLGLISSLDDRDIKYLGDQFVQILTGTPPTPPTSKKRGTRKPKSATETEPAAEAPAEPAAETPAAEIPAEPAAEAPPSSEAPTPTDNPEAT